MLIVTQKLTQLMGQGHGVFDIQELHISQHNSGHAIAARQMCGMWRHFSVFAF